MSYKSWKERSNNRKDQRNTKEPENKVKHKSKKDTTKWCKGKEGKEHTPKCMPAKPYYGLKGNGEWKDLVCTACGKILDKYWPSSFFSNNEPKPDWVTDES